MQSSWNHIPAWLVVSRYVSSWWHCCFSQSLPQTPDCPAAYDKLVQILSGSDAPEGRMGRGRQQCSGSHCQQRAYLWACPKKTTWWAQDQAITQVCKNHARATSRVTEIKVGEHIASPLLISPTLLALWSFRWCSLIWTLIADEGYFLSHESKTPPEGSLPEQAVIHPAPRGGTGRGMYLIRDPRLCAVPCPHLQSCQGGELGFSY